MRTESSGCTANQPALSSSQCAIKDFYPSLYLQADSQQATALQLKAHKLGASRAKGKTSMVESHNKPLNMTLYDY